MRCLLRLLLLCAALCATAAHSAPFRSNEPIMPLSQVKAGMKGVAKTVFRDGKITEFPVEILDVISKKGRPSTLILIRASGPDIERAGGLASGMSGSPVYVGGKLIGAFAFGWDFGDPTMGLVTPIEQMMALFDWPEKKVVFPKARPVSSKRTPSAASRRFDELYESYFGSEEGADADEVEYADYEEKIVVNAAGLSSRACERIGAKLGMRVVEGGAGDNHAIEGQAARPVPGDAVSALLAWGDVTLDAGGTLTAIDVSGRFLAFGHAFKNWGAVSYPLARSSVHGIVSSIESPFKIATSGNIIGTITQDRTEGVAGYIGRYPPSVSVRVDIIDRDRGRSATRRFNVINDEGAVTLLLPELLTGLIDSELGRQSGGSLRYDVTITGNGMPDDWTVGDVVAAEEDVTSVAVGPLSELVGKVLKNPYQSLGVPGLKIKVAATEAARRLFIEKVSVPRLEYHAGDEIPVTVTLRPWRRSPQNHIFKLRVPDDAEGPHIVTARAGIPDGSDPTAELPASDKGAGSFAQFLQEIQSGEHACEVIIELASPDSQGSSETSGEARRRKITDGSLRVFRSEHVVEGSLQVPVLITPAVQSAKKH